MDRYRAPGKQEFPVAERQRIWPVQGSGPSGIQWRRRVMHLFLLQQRRERFPGRRGEILRPVQRPFRSLVQPRWQALGPGHREEKEMVRLPGRRH